MAGRLKAAYALVVLALACLLSLIGCAPIPLWETVQELSTAIPEWIPMGSGSIPAPAPGDNWLFGCAVALSESAEGDFLIIGDQGYAGGLFDGRAYIYRRNGDTWTLETSGTLDPGSATGSAFGASVDISGPQAAVGAYLDGASFSNLGAIYLYQLEVSGWAEKNKFVGPTDDDQLGYAVAIAPDIAVAGSPNYDQVKSNRGRVTVYTYNGSSWSLSPTDILASDAEDNDCFGMAVDVDGQRIAVGAPYRKGTFDFEGKVYIFDYASGWQQQALPAIGSLVLNNYYGQALSVHGDTMFAGAPGGTAFTGVYTDLGGSWNGAPLAALGDGFGCSVGVAQDFAVVGAENENGKRGAVYVFIRTDSGWSLHQTLSPAGLAADSHFGCSVAISAHYLAIGAEGPTTSAGPGTVYVYKLKS